MPQDGLELTALLPLYSLRTAPSTMTVLVTSAAIKDLRCIFGSSFRVVVSRGEEVNECFWAVGLDDSIFLLAGFKDHGHEALPLCSSASAFQRKLSSNWPSFQLTYVPIFSIL
jgi:hypothetical protein